MLQLPFTVYKELLRHCGFVDLLLNSIHSTTPIQKLPKSYALNVYYFSRNHMHAGIFRLNDQFIGEKIFRVMDNMAMKITYRVYHIEMDETKWL